ncbi:MAG TPA: DUF3750 domain-containing protein [Phycisphaerae bacterium]|nr:DUF3750 domain-containing protein [Phycisphaerae bacterium]
MAGCGAFGPSDVPDQSQFAPLAELAANDRAFVRLYGSGIVPVEFIAIHRAFVFKTAGTARLELWELQPSENGPYGHVRVIESPDVNRPDYFDRAFVIAELFDDQAQAVAEFIQTQSPTYPCRFAYELLGPNSSTYIAWILRQTGWDVPFSIRAIGQDSPVNCM